MLTNAHPRGAQPVTKGNPRREMTLEKTHTHPTLAEGPGRLRGGRRCALGLVFLAFLFEIPMGF